MAKYLYLRRRKRKGEKYVLQLSVSGTKVEVKFLKI
jgi:hypothetical protein